MSAVQPAIQTAPEAIRILIIDDEKGPRESLRIILAAQYEVMTADGASEALRLLRSIPIDLVTVDLNMPGMKGAELIRTIREEFPAAAVVVITGCGTLESAVEGIRYGVSDYLSKPFDVIQVTGAVSRALDQQQSRRRLIRFLETVGSVLGRERDAGKALDDLEADQVLQRRLRALLGGAELEPDGARAKLTADGTVEFLEVLAETIERRDTCMRGHARRVAYYASVLADRLGLDVDDCEHVRISSFLHDIGKVGVPSHVLASEALLSAEERSSMHDHVTIGERLVKPLGFSSAVGSAIRHHHERWDGGGYTDGLKGEEIPLASRIIAICDAFDAMTCERPYRRSLGRGEAVQELREHASTQFDPEITVAFTTLVESGVFDFDGESRSSGPAAHDWMGA